MSVQGVMNTRLGESVGTAEANAFVQATAAVLAAAALLFHRDGSFAALAGTSPVYMLGGVLGLIITLTVMLGMRALAGRGGERNPGEPAPDGGGHRRARPPRDREGPPQLGQGAGRGADDCRRDNF